MSLSTLADLAAVEWVPVGTARDAEENVISVREGSDGSAGNVRAMINRSATYCHLSRIYVCETSGYAGCWTGNRKEVEMALHQCRSVCSKKTSIPADLSQDEKVVESAILLTIYKATI